MVSNIALLSAFPGLGNEGILICLLREDVRQQSVFKKQAALARMLFGQSIHKEICLKWLCRIIIRANMH